jgi:hypothetical protein
MHKVTATEVQQSCRGWQWCCRGCVYCAEGCCTVCSFMWLGGLCTGMHVSRGCACHCVFGIAPPPCHGVHLVHMISQMACMHCSMCPMSSHALISN